MSETPVGSDRRVTQVTSSDCRAGQASSGMECPALRSEQLPVRKAFGRSAVMRCGTLYEPYRNAEQNRR